MIRSLVLLICLCLLCHRAWAANCGPVTGLESSRDACPSPYEHPDRHKETILRLVAVSRATAEEVESNRSDGVLALNDISRLDASVCEAFLQDVVSLANVRAVDEGSASWGTISGPGAARSFPTFDPSFKEWSVNGRRLVRGYVVVRWKEQRTFLIRYGRQCVGAVEECLRPALTHLDVHDAAGPRMACTFLSIGKTYWPLWKDKATPIDVRTSAAELRERPILKKRRVKRGRPPDWPADPIPVR